MRPSENQSTHKLSSHIQKPITFSTQFSPQYKQIIKIIDKYLSLLSSNDSLWTVLHNGVRYVSRAPTIGFSQSFLVWIG